MVRTLLAGTGCLVLSLAVSLSAATPLTLDEVGSGFTSPVYVCSPPGDEARLFVVEQPGRIRIIKNGSTLTTPFLDIMGQVSSGGEKGLLGMAFHPSYSLNGYFYVNYTTLIGSDLFTRVSRFSVSGNLDLADAGSEEVILEVAQPYDNHNAGMLAFGPLDGYLYVGTGDGGSGGDPDDRAQNVDSLLGKMLRIDVDAGLPYTIPADNPFVGATGRDELWAYGLRNPWRYSFDRLTGDLYIADVGQGAYEEVDFQVSSSAGGENYGWRLKEGDNCYNPSTDCEVGVTLTDPIYEYGHGGSPFRCSITGGYVYRGCAIPDLQGAYFFGDYCSGQVWTLRYDGVNVTELLDRTAEVGVSSLVSFGEDARGELYVVNQGGRIYKIVPDGVEDQCDTGPCCEGIRGNIDGDPDDLIDIGDLVYLVDYSFGEPPGAAPSCPEEADVDGSGTLDIADVVYLVNFMFGDPPGVSPVACS